MSTTSIGYDPIFLKHNTGSHPECAARLRSVVEHLQKAELHEQLVPVTERVEPDDWIRLVHSPDYIARLQAACKNGDPFIDCMDSAICPDSFEVARQAVSVTLAACDLIMAGGCENSFCAVRPPGHHAEADVSMGFCLFNNVAIACRYLLKLHGLTRILVLDWDVHHGNGTQHLFESENTVYYGSLHQHPGSCYPGTGWADERGKGPGLGYTMNLPLQPGTEDEAWLRAFRTQFMPAAREFRPDFVLISAGFDAHRDDPLAQMNLTERAYVEMTRDLKNLARQFCQGRLLSVLEGGYNLSALGQCAAAHVRELTAA